MEGRVKERNIKSSRGKDEAGGREEKRGKEGEGGGGEGGGGGGGEGDRVREREGE